MSNYEAMEYEAQLRLLERLADIQKNSAPIELSIGWTDKRNMVQQGIVIKSAPPVVTQRLIEQGYSLEIMATGVRVYERK